VSGKIARRGKGVSGKKKIREETRQDSLPSFPATPAMRSPVMGSAHQRPNSALAPNDAWGGGEMGNIFRFLRLGFFFHLVASREELQARPSARVFAGVVHLEGGVLYAVLTGEEHFEVAAAGVTILVLANEDVG
jgi:hypothetical protein